MNTNPKKFKQNKKFEFEIHVTAQQMKDLSRNYWN